MSKQFVVIGLGRFGSSVARALSNMGHEVLVIDNDEEKVQALSDVVVHGVVGDATDEKLLRQVGIRNFDVLIASIGSNAQANVVVTMMAKDLGVKYVVAKAINDLYGKILEKVGADRIVYPERDMGERVAHNLADTNLLDYIELSPEFSIIELVASKRIAGKSLKELDLRAKFGISLVLIKRGNEVNASPGADDVIQEGDILVISGHVSSLEKFQRH